MSFVPFSEHQIWNDFSLDEYSPELRPMKTTKFIQSVEKEHCIVLPSNVWHKRWDVWVVAVLLFVAITMPYRIAFYDNDNKVWSAINVVVDVSFLLDMILTFFTAITDEETNELVTDKRTIALSYFKSWFILDLISILPLDKIAEAA